MKFLIQNRGQLLMESMIAIGVITVGLLGTFTLLSQSLSLNRVLGDRYVATYLASEGIELIKNIIDTNYIQAQPWNSGLTAATSPTSYYIDYNDIAPTPNDPGPLKFDSSTGQYSYDGSGAPTSFIRTVTIEYPSVDEIKINSMVEWTTRGDAQFDVNLEAHFYNWRQPLPPQPL